MMKPKHYLLSAALSVCFLTRAQFVDFSVHFPKGSAVIEQESKTALMAWAAEHQSNHQHEIILRGHTDSDAGNDYNLRLSEKRNKAVEGILRKNGFEKIRHTSHGESWPICESTDEDCMHTNRRVELIVLDTEEEEYAKAMYESSPQTWFVHDLESHEFTSSTGTKIYLPESPFVGVDGTPVKDYRLVVHEFLTPGDCIQHKMFTRCDDKILQTGGMMYIMAYSGREQLQLGKDKSFDVLFPSQMENPDPLMESFSGEIDKGMINWKPSSFMGIGIKDKRNELDYRYSSQFLQKDGTYRQTFIINNSMIDVRYSKTDPPMAYYDCPNGGNCELNSEQRAMLIRAIDGNRIPPGSLTFLNLGWANCDRFLQMNEFVDVPVVCKVNGEEVTIQNNNVLILFPDLNVLVCATVVENELVFKDMPVNQQAIIIAITDQSETPKFGLTEINTSNGAINLELKTKHKEEISTILSDLVWGDFFS